MGFNPFTPNSAKSKIDKFSKITNWVKLKKKSTIVLSGQTFGFCLQNKKLENFVSSKGNSWWSARVIKKINCCHVDYLGHK